MERRDDRARGWRTVHRQGNELRRGAQVLQALLREGPARDEGNRQDRDRVVGDDDQARQPEVQVTYRIPPALGLLLVACSGSSAAGGSEVPDAADAVAPVEAAMDAAIGADACP